MFVRATATMTLVTTGPACWVMISSIGAAEFASTASTSRMASTKTMYISSSMTIEATSAQNIVFGTTKRAFLVSSATSAPDSTPMRPKNGPSAAASQASR